MNEFSQGGRTGGRLILFLVVLVISFLFLCGIILMIITKRGNSVSVATVAPVESSVSREVVAKEEVRPTPVQMMEVIVPVKAIPQGEPLQVAYFAKVSRPVAGLPQNLVRSYDDLKGKFARASLPAMEPVTLNAITREQPVNIVADSIPKGFRAVSISVNATTGVEGWASPGAQVDVQWIADLAGQRTVLMLVQNAKVLSAEREVDPATAGNAVKPIPTTVTLLVSERDAQKISLAANTGSIVLHLRGAEDSGKTSGVVSALSLDDVMRGKNALDRNRKQVQGTARIRREDGSYEEYAIIDGKIMSKVN